MDFNVSPAAAAAAAAALSPAQLLRACFPPTFRSLLLKMSVEQQCLRNMQSYCRVGYFRLFSLGFIFRILFPTNVRE